MWAQMKETSTYRHVSIPPLYMHMHEHVKARTLLLKWFTFFEIKYQQLDMPKSYKITTLHVIYLITQLLNPSS